MAVFARGARWRRACSFVRRRTIAASSGCATTPSEQAEADEENVATVSQAITEAQRDANCAPYEKHRFCVKQAIYDYQSCLGQNESA